MRVRNWAGSDWDTGCVCLLTGVPQFSGDRGAKTPLKVVKQTLSIAGAGKWKFCSFSTVCPTVPAAVSQGAAKCLQREG